MSVVPGDLVRVYMHLHPRVQENDSKWKLGLVLEVTDFVKLDDYHDENLNNQNEWLNALGKRAMIHWSDNSVTTHPTSCLECLETFNTKETK